MKMRDATRGRLAVARSNQAAPKQAAARPPSKVFVGRAFARTGNKVANWVEVGPVYYRPDSRELYFELRAEPYGWRDHTVRRDLKIALEVKRQ